MDADLLKILRCPESGQTLEFAPLPFLDAVNQRIREGSCLNQSGTSVSLVLEKALVRKDGKMLYPIRSDIPVLLPDEAIPCP